MNTLPKLSPSITLADMTTERPDAEAVDARELIGVQPLEIPSDLVMGDRYLRADVQVLLTGPMRPLMTEEDASRANALVEGGGLLSADDRAWLRQFKAWYDPSNMEAVERQADAVPRTQGTKKTTATILRTMKKIASGIPYPRPPSHAGSASVADDVAPPGTTTGILGPVMLIGGLTAVAGLTFYVVKNVK